MRKFYLGIYNEFITDEKRKGLSKQGLDSVKRRIYKFFNYLDELDLTFSEVRIKEAQGFQSWLVDRGREKGGSYASGTILNYIKAASRFYNFLKESNMVVSNPFLSIKKLRYNNPLPKNVLKEKDINNILNALSEYHKQTGLYNQIRYYKIHVIAELQYSTGMRISEVAGLKEDDIDFDRGILTVKEAKGGIERVVFLNEYAKEVLRNYIFYMKDSVLRNYSRESKGLFGAGGGRLTLVVGEVLKEITENLKCSRISSHGFRHAFGSHFLRAGCDLRYIQGFLGHQSITTTEVYTKVEKDDLKVVLDTYHPRKWSGNL
jgi:site-specific recombinase XerD